MTHHEAIGAEPSQHLPNRLAGASSPYLLQHAHNPVDWYPWGDEAFQRARELGRPVFLSIGYATCHWCHVMAHESFEDREVAALLNETFVCIKVDREERPDIDHIYMSVCQLMTGAGGWPLTVLLTADQRPFFAGTYFPREARLGRIGMLELIPRIRELWRQRPGALHDAAAEIVDALTRAESPRATAGGISDDVATRASAELMRRFDEIYGGFSEAPKFPTPHVLLFLLRQHLRTGDTTLRNSVCQTLRAMRAGGIFDHVGYGFHRYSTDRRWLVPHFEKMLYDQALLALAYLEAFQLTREADLGAVAREIFTYVLRDLADASGAFFSAEDADSEGEEGRFYLFEERELSRVLDVRQLEVCRAFFAIKSDGNFHDEASGAPSKQNILHVARPRSNIAESLGLSEAGLCAAETEIRGRLLAERNRRVRPLLDDKILTDWNGLMIAALARGARVLADRQLSIAAERAASFMLGSMRRHDGRLLHRARHGHTGIAGLLEDHAFLVWGLLELYEATFKTRYLREAIAINQQMLDHFSASDHGALFQVADDAESVLTRKVSVYDGAIPSGNSVAMHNLLRIGRITGNPSYEERAARIGDAFAHEINAAPAAHAHLLSALDFARGPSQELVLVGRASELNDLAAEIAAHYLPSSVTLYRPTDEPRPDICELAPHTRAMTAQQEQPTAYVCHAFRCQAPVTTRQGLAALLADS